eukprot:2549213-Rhodomonas_salina.6
MELQHARRHRPRAAAGELPSLPTRPPIIAYAPATTMSGTNVARAAICLCVCYAMPGADTYACMGCQLDAMRTENLQWGQSHWRAQRAARGQTPPLSLPSHASEPRVSLSDALCLGTRNSAEHDLCSAMRDAVLRSGRTLNSLRRAAGFGWLSA